RNQECSLPAPHFSRPQPARQRDAAALEESQDERYLVARIRLSASLPVRAGGVVPTSAFVHGHSLRLPRALPSCKTPVRPSGGSIALWRGDAALALRRPLPTTRAASRGTANTPSSGAPIEASGRVDLRRPLCRCAFDASNGTARFATPDAAGVRFGD